MTKPYMAYHKEYAPEGKLFDEEQHGPLTALGEGWVDSPAKIGVNVWNDPDAEPEIQRAEAQYQRDGIAEDDAGASEDERAELKRLREEAQEREQENQRLREENAALLRGDGVDDRFRTRHEETADARSDAGVDPADPMAGQILDPSTERKPSDLAGTGMEAGDNGGDPAGDAGSGPSGL